MYERPALPVVDRVLKLEVRRRMVISVILASDNHVQLQHVAGGHLERLGLGVARVEAVRSLRGEPARCKKELTRA